MFKSIITATAITIVASTAYAGEDCVSYGQLANKVMDLRQHGVEQTVLLERAPQLEGIINAAFEWPQAKSEEQADQYGLQFQTDVIVQCHQSG